MADLTIIYISASLMPEKWMNFQIGCLMRAANDFPIISVSRKPLDLGQNLIDTEEKCYWNIYQQMLRAAKLSETKYVAMAEDDTLYSRQHFREFRPKDNEVSYNRSRWSLFTWDTLYCMRQRVSNCSLIAPRNYLIDALSERELKYPNGNKYVGEVGRNIVDRRLGVSPRKMVEWYSSVPVVQLNHLTGTDKGGELGRTKRHGQIKAYDIPYWGKATDILQYYGP